MLYEYMLNEYKLDTIKSLIKDCNATIQILGI